MTDTTHTPPRPATAHASGPLKGRMDVPGDKSISHRALMFGALAVGTTRIEGLLEGEDVHATADALRALGVGVTREPDGTWCVDGVGVGGLSAPDNVIDLGNSGTSARLLCGLLAGHGFTTILTGDASLRARPMGRMTGPLTEMGARFEARDGSRMPLSVIGSDALLPIEYTLPVPSAQVKSAVLLAGLHAPGETSVIEPIATRDHTERMLAHMGADIAREDTPNGARITITGQTELHPAAITVPSDPSSAAYPAVAACLVPGSSVELHGIGMNPARAGLYQCLREMGAGITLTDERDEGGEPVADLSVNASELKGITVPPERAASMIDEYPVLAMAAACATGTSVFEGVGELRVKESDRLAAIETGLTACGVDVTATEDSITITGCGGPPPGGAEIPAQLDHRVAMSYLVLGLVSGAPVTVDDISPVETSFPGFADSMRALGADIREGATT